MKNFILCITALFLLSWCPAVPAESTPASSRMFGVTVDRIDNLPDTVEALKKLPVRPWVRLVFDPGVQPATYANAVTEIGAVADIVGQPVDSASAKEYNVAQYKKRFQDYVSAFPTIPMWEISNESNGDWVGKNMPAQADVAFDVVHAAHKKTMITLHYNNAACADKNGDWLKWTKRHISTKIKLGVDLVAVSIYGKDCEGFEPAEKEIQAFTEKLGVMFPHANIGIGEFGSDKNLKDAERVARHYLGLNIQYPRWVFFGGFWYFSEMAVPASKPMWSILAGGAK